VSCGNSASLDDRCAKIKNFIAYFNASMAKPFPWTYQTKPLAV
jgi:hypothetical protein